MNAMRNNTIVILFILIASQLIGCTAMIHNAVVSYYPTFEDTEAAWPSITDNNGRLVVYWPRLPAGGFNPNPFGGMGGMDALNLMVDDETSKRGRVGDQTFVFIDLEAGSHKIEFSHPGPFFTTQKQTVVVNIQKGEIIFLKIKRTFTSNEPASIVDSAEAYNALKDIHHNYKQPVPFDEQKGSMPAI